MSEYKAIIFDLGGVVIDISLDKIYSYWTKVSKQQISQLKNITFDEIYLNYERGNITSKQFREQIKKKFNLTISDNDFDKGWNNIFNGIYPEIEPFLRNLKTKFRIIALTNTNQIHYDFWSNEYTKELSNFEKIFCSHTIGERKPDAKAYRIVLDYLKLLPNQVIFLDDNLENIKTAEKLGIKGILVENPTQMINDLKTILKI